MKTNIILIATLLSLTLIQTAAQDTAMLLSLSQACRLGTENNASVRNAALEQQKSHYRLKEQQSSLYPQIDGYSTFSYYYAIPQMIVPGEIFGQTGMIPMQIGTVYDWNTGFQASQVLFNQSYFTSLKLARQMEALSSLSLEQQKESIVYQVSQLYFLCKNTEKQIEVLSLNLQNNEKLAKITEIQSTEGIILKTDHSRVMVNTDNLRTQLDNLELLRRQQTGLLKYLTGLSPGQNIILTDSLEPNPVFITELLVDFSGNSSIRTLDRQIEISLLSKKCKSEEILPSFSGYGHFYYQGQRNEFDFNQNIDKKFYKAGYLGISLNIPLFNGFEHQAKLRQSDLELQQLRNSLNDTWNSLTREHSDALFHYQNSMTSLQRQEDNIRLAEETYSVSLHCYRQQVIPLSDLFLAEASLTESRLSYNNALFQLKNAELDLRKIKGELLDF